VAYIRNLLITLGEIFIEIGVDNGDIPALVENLTKSTLRSTVNANYVAARYECYGDVAGATKPNLLGDTGNIGGNGETNEQAYAAAGGDRQAWLIAKGVAQPPLEIATLPQDVTTLAGVYAPLSAGLLGGTGEAVTYDWKRVNPTTGATSAAGTGNPFGSAYPLAADAGDFQLFVCDGTWQRAALPVSYTVTPTAFAITQQPVGAARNVGDSVTFSATVRGGETNPSWGWFQIASLTSTTPRPIPGATSPTLTLDNLRPEDAGLYQAQIIGGSALSPVELLSDVVELTVAELVDTVAPEITLNGADTVDIACGAAYTELGATALDETDGDLSGVIAISGEVDTSAPGTYVLTYSVSDLSGNAAQVQRTVTVSDTAKPVLQLLGANPLSLACKEIFTDPGATASDVCDGDLSNVIASSGTVNRNAPGTYTLSYTVSDAAGNSETLTRDVIVADTVAPTITRVGNATITIACGGALNDPGVVANDACAGSLSSSVVVSGAVDTSTVGEYLRTYSVTDPSGNTASTTRSFVVTDTSPPVLTLIGASPLQLACGTEFSDPGATALDACEGVLTNQVLVSGTVNTSSPGSYSLTYSVADSTGNLGQVARTVQVVDTTAPSVTLIGASTVILACGAAFTDPGATASDACVGSLTGSILTSGVVSIDTPGTYTRTYTATDTAGNVGTATRTVQVQDTTAPILTLNGAASINVNCGGIFNDPGATGFDACDGPLGSATILGAIDNAVAGTYTLTYNLSDGEGNVATTTRSVTVLASSTPTLTLLGSSTIQVACGNTYIEPGFAANLGCSGDLGDDVVISGLVDTQNPGSYVIDYSLTTDSASVSRQRTVNVVDTTAPTLSLLGDESITLACGAAFSDPGAAASDACDGNLQANIEVSGNVDASQPGTYLRTYAVADSAGNSASRTRTVTVTGNTTASIELLGASELSVSCGVPFVEGGFVARDTCGEDANARVVVAGGVNTNEPGVYTITYTLLEVDGGPAETERTVTVLADCEITLLVQPFSLRLYEGQTARFSILADGGSAALSYQWYVDDTPLPDANANLLVLEDITLVDAGNYRCVVSNGFTTQSSDTATLEVFTRPLVGQQSADIDGDWSLSLSELLRLIQLYNVGALSCAEDTEDGYAPGVGDTTCAPHTTDYAPQNWIISLSELLRAIQFYNTQAYRVEVGTEDGFAPGAG